MLLVCTVGGASGTNISACLSASMHPCIGQSGQLCVGECATDKMKLQGNRLYNIDIPCLQGFYYGNQRPSNHLSLSRILISLKLRTPKACLWLWKRNH